jgi:hypothetical protein
MNAGLGKEQVTLGSAPDNDVVLQGPGVAPHHARIVEAGGAARVHRPGGSPERGERRPARPPSTRARSTSARSVHPGADPRARSRTRRSSLMLMSRRGTRVAPRAARHRRARGGARVARHRASGRERAARHRHARSHDGRRPRLDERHVRFGAAHPAEPAGPHRSQRRRSLSARPVPVVAARSPGAGESGGAVGTPGRAAPLAVRPAPPQGGPSIQFAQPVGVHARRPQAPHDHRRALARPARTRTSFRSAARPTTRSSSPRRR